MAQIVDHRDLISSFEPGDLPASERIVRVYQNEMLRTAFLLTGTAEGAVLLARDAFLRYFRELVRGDTPEEPRLGLLQALSRSFLVEPDAHPDNGDGPSRMLDGTVALGEEQQRYQVEDDRSRVISLLGLLDRKTRLGIILRDFNALEEESVCQVLDEIPFTLRQRLHPTRDRIRDAAGVGQGHSVRELLVHAATAAPRPNLWPEVLGPLEEYFEEEDERRQRLTYAAAGVVGLLLILAGLWLFDLLPFVSGDDNAAAVAPVAGPTATPTATPEPTVTPTPIPSLSSFAIPEGDVPDRMLMVISSNDANANRNVFGFFDIDSSTFTEYPAQGFPTPSPDGRKLIGFDVEVEPDGSETISLVALDTETAERLWQTEVPRTTYSLAVAGNRVYAAMLDMNSPGNDEVQRPELRAYDLETGELVDTWEDVIPGIQTSVSEFIRIVLLASPDQQRLYIALEEFGSGPTVVSSRTLASYSLPEMTFESASVQTDSTASRQFPTNFSFYDTHVTPDGSFIYRIDVDEEIVQFRSSDTSKDIDLSLPFVQEPGPDGDDLVWMTSNNGRYLYVISIQRAEVAVVDLLARRVERSFPLDFAEALAGQEEAFRSLRSIGDGFWAGLSFSQDGRRLYLAAFPRTATDTGESFESMIWTIDPTTWTVVSVNAIPGYIRSIGESGGALAVLHDLQFNAMPLATNTRLSILDPETGEILSEYSGEGLPEWTESFATLTLPEWYRYQYARAPAVDHIAFENVEIESTLPRISVVTSDETIPAGKTFDLAVRALNPVDGQRLTEEDPTVRFDLDSTVIVRLAHADGEGDPVILVTNRTDPGRFEASASLLEPGYWNAEVTVTGVDGGSRTFSIDEVVQIAPSWEASDGKRYILRVTSDPSQPKVDETAVVTAQFVNIDTGATLPEGVEILAGIPDQIRVAFDSGDRGVANATLELDESNRYEGNEIFWTDGEWEITVIVELESGEFFEIKAGTINVAE